VTPWATFFAAELGASAALTGLMAVAISVNLQRILAEPRLPGRAAEGLIILMGALLVASVMLIPDQPELALGAEVLAVGVITVGAPTVIQLRAWGTGTRGVPLARRIVRAVLNVAGLPFVVAGVLVIRGEPAGLYWAAAGVIGSLVVGVVGAWVLLIEILR
jgi:modulator of FtsH protease